MKEKGKKMVKKKKGGKRDRWGGKGTTLRKRREKNMRGKKVRITTVRGIIRQC